MKLTKVTFSLILLVCTTLLVSSCATIRVAANPVLYDPTTMELLGHAYGQSGTSYADALDKALTSRNADGMLNPQVETVDEELPFGLSFIFPKRTVLVRVSGICFRYAKAPEVSTP